MLYLVSHKMSATFYAPFEDVLSQAHLIFMEAYMTYDPTKGAKFTTWLQWRLVGRLINWLKKEYVEALHVEINEEVAGAMPEADRFALEDMMQGMSAEARMIVRLVCNTPKELAGIIELTKADGKRDIRRTIGEYLADRFGWTVEEVASGFTEIRVALSCYDPPEPVKRDKAQELCGLNRGRVWHITRKYR